MTGRYGTRKGNQPGWPRTLRNSVPIVGLIDGWDSSWADRTSRNSVPVVGPIAKGKTVGYGAARRPFVSPDGTDGVRPDYNSPTKKKHANT